ncbi:MAG: hypothetical protein Q8L26_01745 [Candidatus Omnitrophota bacterium]|nr:hypothetical protein [Candidatus Omnitrophota bacterium]
MRIFTITTMIILGCAITLVASLGCAENDNSGNKKSALAPSQESTNDGKNLSTPVPDNRKNETCSFFDFINKKAYADPVEDKEDKKKLREKWEELTGVDVFYPYFKAKEIEDWVSEKFKVRLFNMKGRMKFDDNKSNANIIYVFSIKF